MKTIWLLLAFALGATACGGRGETTPTDETYTTAGDDDPPAPNEDDPY